MYVFNDCTTDSRVLREAGALSAAGHEVTVIARARHLEATSEEVEARDGFSIIRIPVAGYWRAWWLAARAPWRWGGLVAQTLLTQVGRFPWGWAKAVLLLGSLVLALPYWLARRAIRIILRWAGRTTRPGGGTVAYARRWALLTFDWNRSAARRAPVADVHHGHDMTALPAAVQAAERDGARLVYDSHEIFLESADHAARSGPVRRLLRRLERRWAARATALVTVNRSVAWELERRLHPRRVVVVHNCPPRWDPPTPRPDLLRAAAGIPAGAAVALYHGRLTRDRGIEPLAGALLEPGMERVHGVVMGYGPQRAEYERLAGEPRFGGRLHILDAVPPEELLPWVASADVGIVAIQRTTLNHWLSTPNKLFECLAAGVPVVASDFPEMRRIVGEDPDGPLGILCQPDDVAAVARAIRAIVEAPAAEREALRRRCLRAAHERWNWESEAARLLELYAELS